MNHSDPAHELLGWWYIPFALGVGSFFLWLTTYGIRWFLRRSRLRGAAVAQGRTGIQANVASVILLAAFVSRRYYQQRTAKGCASSLRFNRQRALGILARAQSISTLHLDITRNVPGKLHIDLDFY